MEENREFRPLEIKVMSAAGLKDVNFFFKMDLYAEVKISRDYRTTQTTPVGKHCGRNPKWNYTMKFTLMKLKPIASTFFFYLVSRCLLGDKDIGTVKVPINELLDQKNRNQKVEQRVSYSVRLPNGKAKGTLTFSYKFGEKFKKQLPGADNKHGKKPAMLHLTGYPGPSSGHPPPPRAHPPPPPPMAGYTYPPYPQFGYPQVPVPAYGYPGYPPQRGNGNPKKGSMGAGYPPVKKPIKPKNSVMGVGHPPLRKPPQKPKKGSTKSTIRWA